MEEMKKQYVTPATKAIRLQASTILTGSPANEYGDNQGRIRYSSTEVSAEDAD